MPESAALAEAEAIRAIQRGVLAGYLMAAMNVVGSWLVYFVSEGGGDDRTIMAGSILLMAFIAAALAYQFKRSHSVFIPALLLAWLCIEGVAKFIERGPSAISVVIFGLAGYGLISGLRGALALRKARRSIES